MQIVQTFILSANRNDKINYYDNKSKATIMTINIGGLNDICFSISFYILQSNFQIQQCQKYINLFTTKTYSQNQQNSKYSQMQSFQMINLQYHAINLILTKLPTIPQLNLFLKHLYMDFQQIKQNAAVELIKNRGTYTLQTLKKLQSQFAQKLQEDDIASNLNLQLLKQLKSLLYSYQVLTIQISQQFQFLQIKQFGQSIAKMFYQLIQIVRFLVRKQATLQRKSKIQKNIKNPQINKEQALQQKLIDQFSLKKLKFQQIQKDKFFIANAHTLINQIRQPDQFLDNLSKQIDERKQAVMNISYSKTDGILKETLNLFMNQNKYTNNYIKVTQQNIKLQKSLVQANPDFFYNQINISRQATMNKTKDSFQNLKQKIKRQQIQKTTCKKVSLDKQIQVNMGFESSQLMLKKDFQRKKLQQKLLKQTRQNTLNKQKITSLQQIIQAKNIEINKIQTQLKKNQNNYISLNYQYQQFKQNSALKISSIKNEMLKLTKKDSQMIVPIESKDNIQEMRGKSRKKKKKTYFFNQKPCVQCQDIYCAIENKTIEITILPIILYVKKEQKCIQTDLQKMEYQRQKIDSETMTQLLDRKKIYDQQKQKFNNCMMISQSVQVNLINIDRNSQMLGKRQMMSSKFLVKDSRREYLKNKQLLVPVLRNMKSNGNSVNMTPAPKTVQQQVQVQVKKDDDVVLIKIMSQIKMGKRCEYNDRLVFNEQDLCLFGGQQMARNMENIRLKQSKNIKKSQINNRQTQIQNLNRLQLNNIKSKQNKTQTHIQKFIVHFYKFLKLLKNINPHKYFKIIAYLKYPYSIFKLQSDSTFQAKLKQQSTLHYIQIHKIFKRIFKMHSKCHQSKFNSYYCLHISTFLEKIGFNYV